MPTSEDSREREMLRGRKAKRASDAKAPARAGDARRKALAAARAAFPSPGQGPLCGAPLKGPPDCGTGAARLAGGKGNRQNRSVT